MSKPVQPRTTVIRRPFMVPVCNSPYLRDDPDQDHDNDSDGHSETDESGGDVLYVGGSK